MRTYLIRRLIASILTILGVLTLTFLLVHALPGDAVLMLLRFVANNKAYVEEMRHALGLDQPLLVQYVNWLIPLVTRLDMGTGIVTREPVRLLISQRLPVTIELAFLAMAMSLVISLPLGITAARSRGSWLDYIVMQFSQLCQALPSLWIATLLFFALGVWLRVLPTGGYVPLFEDPVANLKHLLMPALALSLELTGILTRVTRSSVLEVLGKEYIRAAYGRALPAARVLWKHVLRNALIPVMTISGVELGYLLGGAVIIEDIFQLPGVGKLTILSLSQRDIPVIQGCLLFFASFFVFINLFVDILYSVVDPRISLN
jgi:peptide/nickel transport system permease protein